MKKLLFILLFVNFTVIAQEYKVINFTSEPEALSDEINTNVDNAEPKLSPDGETLYFCRRKANKNGDADIWFSKLNAEGKWDKPENLGNVINNETFNQLIGVRSDGNALMILGEYDSNSSANIYITYRDGEGWTKPKALKIKNFEKGLSYGVSADFNTLIISKYGETGDKNLYVSFRGENDIWSEPLYMGDAVNSTEDETFPTIANDGKTLYFSSNGFGGFGSFDIFVCKRLDDSWTKWSKAVNMGNKINTASYDADFTTDAMGNYAYISSSAGSLNDKFRILRIKLPKEARPDPVVMLSGKVCNEKENGLIAHVNCRRIEDGSLFGYFKTDKSGNYKFVLPYGEKYSIRAEAEGHIAVSDFIDLTEIASFKKIKKDLKLIPKKEGSVIKLNNLFFDVGKAELKKDSYLELKDVIVLMNKNKGMKIEIRGHTDNTGTNEKNKILSEKRAKAVADYLIKNKIDTGRLKYKGYGETKPVATNKTEKGRQKNRRVEFVITKLR